MRRVNFGSRGDDDLSFSGGQRAIFGRRGDDTITYNANDDSDRWRYVDGGRGDDTLVLELTQEQWDSGAFLADLQALADHADNPSWFWCGFRPFVFDSLYLVVRSIENVLVNVDGEIFDPLNPPTGPEIVEVSVTYQENDFGRATNSRDPLPDTVAPPTSEIVLTSTDAPAGVTAVLDVNGNLLISNPGDSGSPTALDVLQVGESATFTGSFLNDDNQQLEVSITIEGEDDPTQVTTLGSISGEPLNSFNAQVQVTDPDNEIVSFRRVQDEGSLGALTASDFLILDETTGELSFDAAGAQYIDGPTIQFAVEVTLGNGTTQVFDQVVGISGFAPPPPPPPPPPPRHLRGHYHHRRRRWRPR